MSAPADFERAKSYLSKKQGKTSVYDHLSEVLLKLITEQPDNALDVLEHVSQDLRKGASIATAKLEGGEGKVDAGASDAAAAWAADAGAKFDKSKLAELGDQRIVNTVDQLTTAEWAGVSIGREEAFRLYLSIKHHAAADPERNDLRFWGKILGTGGDYYILEGTDGKDVEADEDAKQDEAGAVPEAHGKGANLYQYWVCSYAGGAWTQLPDVTPAQVRAARKIRRFFTGDLSAPVSGHPPFPGNEAAFLRATVAIISAETHLCPKDLYDVEEGFEGLPLNAAEEPGEGIGEVGAGPWCHLALAIDPATGRCDPMPPADPDEDEAEPAKPLAEIEEEEEAKWSARAVPASAQGDDAPPDLVAMRSLAWPGAVAVGIGNKYHNVYVGYGHEHRDTVFMPPLPAALANGYDINEEEKEFRLQADVTTDPDAGAADGDGDGDGDGDDE